MQNASHRIKKALSVWMTALLICLPLSGCKLLESFLSEQAPPADSSSQEESAPKVRSGAAMRGADLQSISAVGELEEPPPEESLEEARTAQEDGPETPLAWDLSLLPYRAMLTPPEQDVYDEIYGNIQSLTPQFSLLNDTTTERINDIVHAVYYDNPELFWIDSSYRYGYTSDQRITNLTIHFNETAENFAAGKEQFEAAADKIIEGAMAFSSDLEKEKYVHDALVTSVEYRLNSPLNQSAYSALVEGKSVCAGYSRAFQYILMKLGIPCYYAVGYAEQDHAWNIVELDGQYYNVDLSWNDPIGNPPDEIHYEYFNITDGQMAYDHERRDLSVNLPPCQGTDLSYNSTFGADSPVQAGGRPRECGEAGFSEGEVIASVEAYYAAGKAALIASGPGEQVQSFLLEDEALRARIYQVIADKGWFNAFVAPAARALGMETCNAEISVSYEPMLDGHVLLTQTLNMTE